MTEKKLDKKTPKSKLTMKVLAIDLERVVALLETLDLRQKNEMDIVFDELNTIYRYLVVLVLLLTALVFTQFLLAII